MADDIARLVAVLEADLKGFTKGMEQAQRIADQRFGAIEKKMRSTETAFSGSFKNIAALATRYLGTAALASYAISVIKSTAALNDQAATLGVSTDALQAYHASAILAGAGAEAGDEAIRRFTRSLGDAAEAPGPARKALADLGLTAKDLAGGPEATLPKVATAMLKIADVTERARLETALFGKSGQVTEQLLKGWADPDLIKRMTELGFVIDKSLIESAEKATIAWDVLWLHIKAGVAQGIFDWLPKTIENLKNFESGSQAAARAAKQLLEGTPRTSGIPFLSAKNVIPVFKDEAGDKARAQAAEKARKAALEAAFDAANKMRAFNENFDRQILADIARTADANVPGALIALGTGGATAAADAIKQAKELRDTITQITDEADQRIAELASEKNIAHIDQLRDAFSLIGAAGVRSFDNIGDAAKQAAQQLASVVFQITIMEPLLRLLTGEKGQPLGGILGQLFNSIGGGGGGFGFPDTVDITPGRFASGGRPPMNRWSIVGEHGPEWFKPDTAGIIIPSASARGGAMNLTIQNVVQLAGANGDQTIREYARRGAVEGAALAVSHIRKNLPGMMVTATQRSL